MAGWFGPTESFLLLLHQPWQRCAEFSAVLTVTANFPFAKQKSIPRFLDSSKVPVAKWQRVMKQLQTVQVQLENGFVVCGRADRLPFPADPAALTAPRSTDEVGRGCGRAQPGSIPAVPCPRLRAPSGRAAPTQPLALLPPAGPQSPARPGPHGGPAAPGAAQAPAKSLTGFI